MAHSRARNTVIHQYVDDILSMTRSRTKQNGHGHISYGIGVHDENPFPVVVVRQSGFKLLTETRVSCVSQSTVTGDDSNQDL